MCAFFYVSSQQKQSSDFGLPQEHGRPVCDLCITFEPGRDVRQVDEPESTDLWVQERLTDFGALSSIEAWFSQTQWFQWRILSNDLLDHGSESLAYVIGGIFHMLDLEMSKPGSLVNKRLYSLSGDRESSVLPSPELDQFKSFIIERVYWVAKHFVTDIAFAFQFQNSEVLYSLFKDFGSLRKIHFWVDRNRGHIEEYLGSIIRLSLSCASLNHF